MRIELIQKHHTGGSAAVAALGVLLAFSGCGLDEVKVPELSGPSELALSLKLTASPDILTADGVSTSSVQAEVRGPDGKPLSGRGVYFIITDGFGNIADIGTLSANEAATNGSGTARVVYTVPARTDATGHQTVLILARPIGDDANGQVYRQVRIELRSAEPRFFPQIPGNTPPTCNFNIETPQGTFVGSQILFKSTASDPDPGGFIIRYYWDFGDGATNDKPDVNHAYGFSGTYTVTHLVTDNGGLQSACATRVRIF